MKRALLILGGIAGLLMLVAAGRPPSDLQLFTMLNGQPARWVMSDAGRSGMYAASGQGCATMGSSTPSVVKLKGRGSFNVCVRPSAIWPTWDGGCSLDETDLNFGDEVQARTDHYIVLEPTVTHICAVSDAGTVNVTAWRMQ